MSKSIRTQIAEVTAKIAAANLRLNELNAKLAASEFAPAEGTTLEFNYGKKTREFLKGIVLGVKRPEAGKPGGTFVVLEVGTGMDKRVLTVPVGDIVIPAAE